MLLQPGTGQHSGRLPSEDNAVVAGTGALLRTSAWDVVVDAGSPSREHVAPCWAWRLPRVQSLSSTLPASRSSPPSFPEVPTHSLFSVLGCSHVVKSSKCRDGSPLCPPGGDGSDQPMYCPSVSRCSSGASADPAAFTHPLSALQSPRNLHPDVATEFQPDQCCSNQAGCVLLGTLSALDTAV